LRFDCKAAAPSAIFSDEDIFNEGGGDEGLYDNGEMFMGGVDSTIKK
jgi:hypothetical protein